jgi:hypothetical protein
MICSKKHNPDLYHSSVAQSPPCTLVRGVFLCPAVFLLIAIGIFRQRVNMPLHPWCRQRSPLRRLLRQPRRLKGLVNWRRLTLWTGDHRRRGLRPLGLG